MTRSGVSEPIGGHGGVARRDVEGCKLWARGAGLGRGMRGRHGGTGRIAEAARRRPEPPVDRRRARAASAMFHCIVQPRHDWGPPDLANAFPGRHRARTTAAAGSRRRIPRRKPTMPLSSIYGRKKASCYMPITNYNCAYQK